MDKITYTEKRFFEWHEDEVSVSIRACSGSYGGGNEAFVVDELIPSVLEPIGADLYNQTTTGNVSKTLNSIKSDSDHVPCVIYAVDMGGGKPSSVFYENVSPTLCTTHYGEPVVTEPIVVRDEMTIKVDTNGKVFALRGRDYKSVQCVVTENEL